jgi:hypothetical protein
MLSPVNKISVMKYAHLMNRDMLLYYSFFFSQKGGVLTHYNVLSLDDSTKVVALLADR